MPEGANYLLGHLMGGQGWGKKRKGRGEKGGGKRHRERDGMMEGDGKREGKGEKEGEGPEQSVSEQRGGRGRR